MSKNREKKDRKLAQPYSGAEIPSHDPAFNGELPHSSKKVSLGPNTKR